MKKIKFAVIFGVIFAAGCSNLDMLVEQPRPVPNVQDLRFSPVQTVTQNSRVFNMETALNQIEDIKISVRERKEREYTLESRDSTYEIYVGEYLKFPSTGVARISLLNTDSNLYDSRTTGGYYYFRSIYQGDYNIKIDFQNGASKVVRVVNKMKYRFTERETYDIIRDAYNSGKYKEVLDLVDLYGMAFRTGSKNLELGFLVLDIYMNNGNYSYAKEKISELKREKNLSNRDILTLFNHEISLDPNYIVENFYIENSRYNRDLDFSIREHLKNKREFTTQEGIFMGKIAPQENLKFQENIKNEVVDSRVTPVITSHQEDILPREEARVVVSATSDGKKQYESGKVAYEKGRYNEAILLLNRAERAGVREEDMGYYLGDSYFKTEEYSKAVENYKKYFNSSEDGIRKAESYYNCGIAYEKLGDKEQALTKFKKVMELFPGTSWARRANIYIVRLKN